LHHEGGEVLSLIAIANSAADADLPEPMPRPLEGKTKTRLRQGQKFIEAKALELNMPVEMLIRKRWLITILQNMRAGESVSAEQDAQALLPEELLGWRYSLLMPGLLQAMTKL
jgi:ribonuclease D